MSALVWRHVTAEDLDGPLHALVEACEEADGCPYRMSADEVMELFEDRDLAADTWLVADVDTPVAWGLVQHDEPDERPERDRIVLWGGVAPNRRGEGIGAELFSRQVARARAVAAGLDLPVDARVYPETDRDGRAALAVHHGFTIARFFEELRRDLAPLEVATPTAVTVRAWGETDDEAARLVKNAAFRDHWGSTEVTADAWRRQLRGSTTRRDLSRVAVTDDDTIVGLLLAAHYPQDRLFTGHVGWVELLAVDAGWRGHGVATALLAAAVSAFREAGFEGAMLGVDAASPTGAGRLYRGLGFTSWRTTTCWSLALDDPPPPPHDGVPSGS